MSGAPATTPIVDLNILKSSRFIHYFLNLTDPKKIQQALEEALFTYCVKNSFSKLDLCSELILACIKTRNPAYQIHLRAILILANQLSQELTPKTSEIKTETAPSFLKQLILAIPALDKTRAPDISTHREQFIFFVQSLWAYWEEFYTPVVKEIMARLELLDGSAESLSIKTKLIQALETHQFPAEITNYSISSPAALGTASSKPSWAIKFNTSQKPPITTQEGFDLYVLNGLALGVKISDIVPFGFTPNDSVYDEMFIQSGGVIFSGLSFSLTALNKNSRARIMLLLTLFAASYQNSELLTLLLTSPESTPKEKKFVLKILSHPDFILSDPLWLLGCLKQIWTDQLGIHRQDLRTLLQPLDLTPPEEKTALRHFRKSLSPYFKQAQIPTDFLEKFFEIAKDPETFRAIQPGLSELISQGLINFKDFIENAADLSKNPVGLAYAKIAFGLALIQKNPLVIQKLISKTLEKQNWNLLTILLNLKPEFLTPELNFVISGSSHPNKPYRRLVITSNSWLSDPIGSIYANLNTLTGFQSLQKALSTQIPLNAAFFHEFYWKLNQQLLTSRSAQEALSHILSSPKLSTETFRYDALLDYLASIHPDFSSIIIGSAPGALFKILAAVKHRFIHQNYEPSIPTFRPRPMASPSVPGFTPDTLPASLSVTSNISKIGVILASFEHAKAQLEIRAASHLPVPRRSPEHYSIFWGLRKTLQALGPSTIPSAQILHLLSFSSTTMPLEFYRSVQESLEKILPLLPETPAGIALRVRFNFDLTNPKVIQLQKLNRLLSVPSYLPSVLQKWMPHLNGFHAQSKDFVCTAAAMEPSNWPIHIFRTLQTLKPSNLSGQRYTAFKILFGSAMRDPDQETTASPNPLDVEFREDESKKLETLKFFFEALSHLKLSPGLDLDLFLLAGEKQDAPSVQARVLFLAQHQPRDPQSVPEDLLALGL